MSQRVSPIKRRTRRRNPSQSLKKRKAGNASQAAELVLSGRVLALATPHVSQEERSTPAHSIVAQGGEQKSNREQSQTATSTLPPLPRLPLVLQHPELENEKTITVKEAAFRLGKSQDAVYLWLRTGRLLGWQPGGRGCAILVSEASVEAALSSTITCA